MKSLLILIFVLTATGLRAEERGNVRPLMYEILDQVNTLRPYMGSDARFSDPKNSDFIEKKLNRLAELAKQAASHPKLQSPGFRISGKVLEEHTTSTAIMYHYGSKGYARSMLNSLVNACMGCHTQLPSNSRTLWSFDTNNLEIPAFDQAEFLFATRAFDSSVDEYDKLIEGYPSSKLSDDQLDTALRRKLTYFARVKRSPDEAIKSFDKNLKNEHLPKAERKNIEAWQALFREWKKEPALDPKAMNDDQVLKFAKNSMKKGLWDKMIEADDPRAVTYLKVSGVLYDYLNAHPETKAEPEILLWLGRTERALKNFSFSLPDLYLRECMIRFPRSPVAKDCYGEYKASLLESMGKTDVNQLPDTIRRDLNDVQGAMKPK